MERADPHLAVRSKQAIDAGLHLSGCLVGERYCQDISRMDILPLYQVCNPVSDHTRLATTRTGQDKNRPPCDLYCLALFGI
jgi:hypothetical protein